MPFTATTLAALVQASGFSMWRYATTDSRATVAAAGYFAAAAGQLRAGDLMLLQAADAVALLPVRSGPALGPGVTLDGAVGPLATVRSVAFPFTVTQAITAVVRTIVLAPLAAGIVLGAAIPVSAQVSGPVSQVRFSILDSTGTLVPPAVTAPVTAGSAGALLATPPLGSGYRILAQDAGDLAFFVRSPAFNVTPDLQFMLQESAGHLLLETGSALKN